ncbi:MAG: manganese efflux pump MntP family protein [Lachnospiraceae bacterium]|nr:manganese efflux pump MntP family protein [Lachnospiraceae bacterium]
MGFNELFILAVGLSMDAFAVAVCIGLGMEKITVKKALVVGLYFGGFQALMPLTGYLIASIFADNIISYGSWIAFSLLVFLGFRMILGSFKKESDTAKASLKPKEMFPLAIATSIDALAVGVSFAFLQVSIIPAVSLIGITTLIFSMIGVKIGTVFGMKFKSKAELAGGVILILIGLKILLEYLGVI